MTFLFKFATLTVLARLQTTRAQDELYLDPTADLEERVQDLMARMSLRDKIGQMVIDAENTMELAPNLGAFLVGASDPPPGNTPAVWRARFNTLEAGNAQPSGIPLIFGTDAVHGNNIIKGATIFPHNIGLGATKNVTLIKEVAEVTAEEMIISGLDLTFAPTIAVVRDFRWGRTYESYSENTELVTSYAGAFISGLQGNSPPYKVIATAKHWVGDGGTTGGIDAGDTALDRADLMKIHGAPYVEAIKAGVGSIMVSFSSVNGLPMHEHQELIQTVLKGDMGFDGFVLSDWEGYTKNSGNYTDQVIAAVNAGIDMIMGPYLAYYIMLIITTAVEQGVVETSRIDDAAERIVRTKIRAGLFEKKADPLDEGNVKPLGTPAHRAVARQAVRESLVLLQNYGALPLQKEARILLAGKSANNIRNQCGGWTMSWQGTSEEERHLIVGGTTIMEGMEALSEGTVTYSSNGEGQDPESFDVAVAVVGETPYAEFEGDRKDLSLDAEDRAVIETLKGTGLPIVLVLVSGRPMIMTDILGDVDAVVAAWLPGTEGDGVAQVLYGDSDFSGTLSVSWPASMGQVESGFVGDNPNALFAYGYGRTYADGPQQRPAESTASPTGSPTKETTTGSPTGSPSSVSTGSPTAAPSSSSTGSPTESPVKASGAGSPSDDSEAPTKPDTPKLTDSSSQEIAFSWKPAKDNVGVDHYLVYNNDNVVQETSETNVIVIDLEPGTLYSFSVSAVDAAGNEGPRSSPLLVSTTVMVDTFNDQDALASDGWGEWRVSVGGESEDGSATLQLDAPGYRDSAAQMVYKVDSGGWGFANMFLDFDEGQSIDLSASEAIGLRFQVRGESGASFNVKLGTPLAEWNWMYYEKPFQTSLVWTQVVFLFSDLQPSSADIPYTIADAVKNSTSIVWETTDVDSMGWLMLDEVEFMTPTSTIKVPESPENSAGPSSAPSDGGTSGNGEETKAPSSPPAGDVEPTSAPSADGGQSSKVPTVVVNGSGSSSARSIFTGTAALIVPIVWFACFATGLF